MNDYYCEIPNIFNVKYISAICKTIVTDEWLNSTDIGGLAHFTDVYPIAVEDHPYLQVLRDNFPKLFPYVKVLKNSEPTWPVHVDNHRRVSITIPVANTGPNKLTTFHEGGETAPYIEGYFGNDWGTWDTNEYLEYVVNSTPAVEYAIQDTPVLINTSKPHGVLNKEANKEANKVDPNPRLIATWGYEDTYENALRDFNANIPG